LGAIAVAFVVAGGWSGGETSADGYVPPATPPAEYQALYDELSQNLTTFDAQIDAEWDGSVGDGQFAASLSVANGQRTVSLLTAATWTSVMQQLDAYESMGVTMIKLDVEYPLFTPAFHTYLTAHPPWFLPDYTITVPNFVGAPTSFYNKVATEIRSRGMGIWIEYGTLFQDYSPTPPAGYFAEIRTSGLAASQARYTSERSMETALLVSQLKPDYFTILEEPDTQAMNFGYFPGQVPIFSDVAGWRGVVESGISAITTAAPTSPTLLGAGTGVWVSEDYVTQFASLPGLDYIDLHIYPMRSLTQNYLQTTLDWIDDIHSIAPGKLITIGETWAYKESAAEVSGGGSLNDILARDVYSFWEPLDRQFLEMLSKLMHNERLAAVMPFWATYFFAYLTYGDPSLEGLGPIDLLSRAGQDAAPNIASVTLTGTGEKFAELATVPPDADGDGIADSTDSSDTDGDGVADSADACPLYSTSWPVPSGDTDCDGFPDSVLVSGTAPESYIGTKPIKRCATTTAANDEPSADAWAVDFNDNRIVNGQDVGRFAAAYGNAVASGPFGAPPLPGVRFDYSGNGVINGQDVGKFSAYYGKSCA
jgi:hypothetical protein